MNVKDQRRIKKIFQRKYIKIIIRNSKFNACNKSIKYFIFTLIINRVRKKKEIVNLLIDQNRLSYFVMFKSITERLHALKEFVGRNNLFRK